MRKITDDTLVKVKVPRRLYESIKSKLVLREAQEIEEKKGKEGEEDKKEDDKPKYAGTKMSKGDRMNQVGRSKPNTVRGDMAKAYTPVHAMAKEGEEHLEEGPGDIVNAVIEMLKALDPQTLGMIATAVGLTGGAAALGSKIKSTGSQPGSSTGAYTEGKRKH